MLIGNNIFLVTFGLIISQILTPQITKITDITFFVLLFQTIIVTVIILITAEFLPKTIFRTLFQQNIKNICFTNCIVFYYFKTYHKSNFEIF